MGNRFKKEFSQTIKFYGLSEKRLKNNYEDVLLYGANIPDLVRVGGIYRLVSSVFIHANIIHLICNMYSLFQIGPTIEYFFGKEYYSKNKERIIVIEGEKNDFKDL